MAVKLIRYTYKTNEQPWNKRRDFNDYQKVIYDNYKQNVVEKQSGFISEEPTVWTDNTSAKVYNIETFDQALEFFNNIRDESNPFVKAYKDTIFDANNYVHHEVQTVIEKDDGSIYTIQPRLSS
jgi:hypothetical protein